MQFYGPPTVRAAIQEKLRFSDEIIRHTLIKRASTLKHMIR